MELDDLKTAWLSNDEKLEKSLALNEQSIAFIQTRKVVSKLTPLYRQRVIECIFHSLATVSLIVILNENIAEFHYAISALALLAFYLTTLINALKQIKLIKNMDLNKDLAAMQSALAILQTHIVNYAKLAI